MDFLIHFLSKIEVMSQQSIEVQKIEAKAKKLKIELPFLSIPITMNRAFFDRRLKSGYFKIINPEVDHTFFKKNRNGVKGLLKN